MKPYKRRRPKFFQEAKVYRNLHRGGYSIVQRGRVVAHADYVEIKNARFVVQPAGRDRVRATGRKCVHAFVVGTLNIPILLSMERRASYNPRADTGPHFIDVTGGDGTGNHVERASYVKLGPDGVRFNR